MQLLHTQEYIFLYVRLLYLPVDVLAVVGYISTSSRFLIRQINSVSKKNPKWALLCKKWDIFQLSKEGIKLVTSTIHKGL
jgi:hypothetical protein